ncbi:MAG: NTP transferase domain-containing protein [Spirochaetaceae bacterium]|jgi:CTP:phosphocholine cytidylyltransferase-like protein/thiamine kinase-like enzyme|nr:NTP transferase domain-containing protein [Spirochaetaceae bacterium]
MPKVDNAIILAAGTGSRFVPLTLEKPKGLVRVHGIPMIERQIEQLKECGISEIIIVTGFLKEKFDYLAAKYHVTFVHNPAYARRNNLSSLYYARDYLKNSYILSSDNWMSENIFHEYEERSWYSCVYNTGVTKEWCVTVDAEDRLQSVVVGGHDSWVMYGPVFFTEDFSRAFSPKIAEYYCKNGTENYMWENVFIDEIKNPLFTLYINRQNAQTVFEFESVDELRTFDSSWNGAAESRHLALLCDLFSVHDYEITALHRVKEGMTNRSFSFCVHNTPYIFRVPGEGSNTLINRVQEKSCYDAVQQLGIMDKIVYFDTVRGEKISFYYEDAHNTCADNPQDVQDSCALLRTLHHSGICVAHTFDIGAEIARYISLCIERNVINSVQYISMNERLKPLVTTLQQMNINNALCHIDCNPDNFIRLKDGTLRLIDWEYAGMCDPLIDCAMYAIYSAYDEAAALSFLNVYLQRDACAAEKMRLFGCMCLGGFLWALWTEYKKSFGIEFGNYGSRMYRYTNTIIEDFEHNKGVFA